MRGVSRLDEPYMPIKVIVTAKNTESMPLDLPEQHTVVYERERDSSQEYLAVLNSLSAEERRAVRNNTASEAVRARLDGLEPHRDWDIFRAINPAALIGYNRLCRAVVAGTRRFLTGHAARQRPCKDT